MQSCDFIMSISALACAISKCCTKEELATLSLTFTQLGFSLTSLLAHEEICKIETQKQEEPEDINLY